MCATVHVAVLQSTLVLQLCHYAFIMVFLVFSLRVGLLIVLSLPLAFGSSACHILLIPLKVVLRSTPRTSWPSDYMTHAQLRAYALTAGRKELYGRTQMAS